MNIEDKLASFEEHPQPAAQPLTRKELIMACLCMAVSYKEVHVVYDTRTAEDKVWIKAMTRELADAFDEEMMTALKAFPADSTIRSIQSSTPRPLLWQPAASCTRNSRI
jgi:hypothetical protein